MARMIDKQVMLNLIIDAKRTDPETGSFAEWLAEYLVQHLPTLTQPNEPLTLEELREMNGEPVWVKRLKGLSVCDTDWAVVEFRIEPDVKHYEIRVWWPGSEDEDTPSEEDYGKTWMAYRRPPEGEEETK